MRVMITIFSDSVLGNITNDTGSFCLAKYIIFAWLWSNLAILYMVVDEFFVHSHVHGCIQNLKSTLKPFSRLLWTPNPLCQKPRVQQWNNILEILPLKLLLLESEDEDVKVLKISFLLISPLIYHFFEQNHWTKNIQHQILHTSLLFFYRLKT